MEEVDLLAGAGADYDRERFLRGEVSPVFFGSALTNYGVEQFLRGFPGSVPAAARSHQ
jgi:peptide chain release factor 3